MFDKTLKILEEVMLDTLQANMLADIQKNFLKYIELTFISAIALKELSSNQLVNFLEIANYYIQVRLSLPDKDADQYYPLMKELGLYCCLKTMVLMMYLLRSPSVQVPPQNLGSLIGCFVEYLKMVHIYRGMVFYMRFIADSLGRLAAFMPANFGAMKDELLSIASLIGMWLQDNYMPNRVASSPPYKNKMMRSLLASLEQAKFDTELSPALSAELSNHLTVLSKPLVEWFGFESAIIQMHKTIMEGKNASLTIEDIFNLLDRSAVESWAQRLATLYSF